MLYKPHTLQETVHLSDARYKVLNWGRRTGKSTLAVNYTVGKALEKYRSYVESGKLITGPFNYFIVGPTFRQTKSVYWNDIIKTQIPNAIIDHTREDELRVEIPHHNIPNKSPNLSDNAKGLPAIVIELKGSENEDSLRGVKLSGVVLDECAFMTDFENIWRRILKPALSDERGWAIFISTPNGFNHFYEFCEDAQKRVKENSPRWFYSHATIYDNPYIDREEIQEIKDEELGKDPDGTTWHQEYMADFRQMKGLVFPNFNREKHLVKAERIPEYGTDLLGIDFGYENPLAAVFVRIDYDNNWWIYDLLYQTHLTTDQAIQILRDKMTGKHFASIVGDSAAAQEIANFKNRNFPIVPSVKGRDSIKSGIRLIADKLKIQEGTGQPKLFILESLKDIVMEFETYAYHDAKEGLNMKEVPIDSNNHAIDALRYIMQTNAEYRKPYQRRQRFFDPVTGRALS